MTKTPGRTLLLALVTGPGLALAGAGCSDDEGGNGNSNSNSNGNGNGNGNRDPLALDDDLLEANNAPASYTCLDATDPALTFITETEVTGVVEDFELHTPVSGIVVSVYVTQQDLIEDDPFDVSEPSGASGEYRIMVPPEVQRVHWKSTNPAGQEHNFDTLELADPVAGLPPGPPLTTGHDRQIISTATVETVPISLGIARIEGRGVIAGTLYDCARKHVENAAVRVYDGPPEDTGRQLIFRLGGDDLNTFYFSSGMPSRLQRFTDPADQFLTANLVAGGPVWVEMWGRLEAEQTPDGWTDCAAGCLVAIQQVPVIADTIVIGDLNPAYAED